MRGKHYESDAESFDADAYWIDGWGKGIAWYVLGWETEPNEETEWSGVEESTGRVVCRMVGDDRYFQFDPDEIHALDRFEYCGECGQVGCAHDGYDRGKV